MEKQITPAEALNADEMFIAVSSKDVVPVIKFEDKLIGDGKPGKYAKKLMEEFKNLVK
jgi:branched-subunit amino acid aminotransferase/4-amino-4-deoxychorismate lyase